MKVSIITATYNSAATLPDTLTSIRSQKHDDIEHIIVDGASDDNSLSIIKDYSASTGARYISEPDSGIYSALNKGVAMASGDIIGLLHADDCFAEPQTIAAVAAAFADSTTNAVYGDLEYIAKNNPQKIIRYWKSSPYTRSMLQRGWMPPHPTFFARRAVFEKYGSYDEEFTIAGDYELLVKLLYKHKIKATYLNRVITKMKVGGASNRSVSNIIKKMREDYRVIREYELGGPATLLLKNSSKIGQFFKR